MLRILGSAAQTFSMRFEIHGVRPPSSVIYNHHLNIVQYCAYFLHGYGNHMDVFLFFDMMCLIRIPMQHLLTKIRRWVEPTSQIRVSAHLRSTACSKC